MKKLLLLLAPLTLGLMVGCSYDDSAILDKIAEMEKEQNEMEKEHDEMQAQLDAQQALLDALANNLTITAVTQTDNGYTITFSDGTSMTIKDGEKGEKGDKGDKGDKGEQGDSFIESIVVGEEDVTFTLTDGTVIVIPLGSGGSSDGGEPSAENNKIYYTTFDGKKLFPYNTEPAVFGAILVSNTYEDGQGVLTFDDTITSIGEKAFSNCSSLTNITIPDSVTSIGYNAFSGCLFTKETFINNSSLDAETNNYWGASIYDIIQEDGLCINGTIAVDCRDKATSVTIPDSVTSIGSSAFRYCTSLTSITIPDSVTSIGEWAFSDCDALTSITIPDSVTEIGERAFSYCSSLTSATIGNGVTSIGEWAFSDCDALTSVTIGNGVTSIGRYAFYSCSSLTSITIPDSAIEIGDWAFEYCSSLTDTYVNITDLAAYATGNRTYRFPGAKHLMINGTEITELVIPFKEVTMIGESAFYRCTSLTSITIPETVFEIGDSAFDGCTSLTSVYITDIAAWCGISFGDAANPLDYAHNLYLNGELVTNLVIPDSVTEIGGYAFSGCTSLTSVTIPDSVTSIGGSAFSGCTGELIINSKIVETYYNYNYGYYPSFEGWLKGAKFSKLTIGNGVTSIGSSAFCDCTSLTSITIPDSVTSIGERAFSYCSSLTSVTIGNGVTSIGRDAFSGCSSLTSVTIPDSVTSIGSSAFYYCSSLTSITIPDSVTSIGGDAFWGCTSLTSVYCKPTTPPRGNWSMFDNNASGRKIYVPTESVDAYKNASYWSEYADAIEPYVFE